MSSVEATPTLWERKRGLLLLLLVLGIGAAIQAFVMTSSWADWDEGQYMQGALALAQGGFPDVTFSGRSDPLLLLVLAPAVGMFGANVLVGRAVEVLINVGTAAIVAMIAQRLMGKRGPLAGTAAAAVYLILPLALNVETRVLEEQLGAFFVMASLYMLLRERWVVSRWNFPCAGLFLGLAILSRRSTVAVGVVWLLWIVYTRSTWKDRVLSGLRCFLPGILVTLAFYVAVGVRTNLSWMVTVIAQSSYIPYGEPVAPLSSRIVLLGYIFVVASPVFMVPLVLLVRHLRGRGEERLAGLAAILSTVLVMALVYSLPAYATYGLGETAIAQQSALILFATVLWIVLLGREMLSLPSQVPLPGDIMLLVFACGLSVLLLDFLPRPYGFVNYAADALAPLALLFGVWATTLVPEDKTAIEDSPTSQGHRFVKARRAMRRSGVPSLLLALLVVSSLLVALCVYGPTNPANVPGANGIPSRTVQVYPPSEITAVGGALRSLVTHHETVFSFDTVFLGAADLQDSPQISLYLDPYLHALESHVPNNVSIYPGAPPGLSPSLDQLLSYWNQTGLEWVVVGTVTENAEMASPLLAWYISTNFHPVASFGDPLSYDQVFILQRGSPPNPVASPMGPPASLVSPSAVTTSENGTVYAASLNSSFLTYLAPNGHKREIPLLFTGARAIGTFFNELWVGSTFTPQVEIIPLNGSAPLLVPGPQAASAFAADTLTDRVFVSGFTGGNVTAIGATPQDPQWHDLWTTVAETPVTGLAVNSSSQLLYAALPYKNAIEVLSESNGTTVVVQSLPFAPFGIYFADGGLVATWWSAGTVFRLVPDLLGAPRVVGSLYVGGALTVVEGVPSLNAVVVPSNGTLIFLTVDTLLHLGTFLGFPCGTGVTVNSSLTDMGVLDACNDTVSLWGLPPIGRLAVEAPVGSALEVDYNPLTTISVNQSVVSIPLWPQEVSLSLSINGSLPGFVATTMTNGTLYVSISPGPTLDRISQLQTAFIEEVVTVSILAYLGSLALIVYEPRGGRPKW